MRTDLVVGLCIVFLLVAAFPVFSAVQMGYESVAVARIVGDTPAEMVRQLRMDELNLNRATYFSDTWKHDDTVVADQINSILDEEFNGNYESHLRDSNSIWSWNDVSDSVNQWNSKNLFVVEAKGDLDDNEMLAKSPYLFDGHLQPDEPNWYGFSTYNPLFIFNSEYAGLYLPKMDSFVGKLGQDSIMIAPTANRDTEFVKTFVCNLGRYDNLGKTYRNARNNYYWQTNRPSGLALMAFTLYGNPLASINIPDMNPSSDYCSSVIKDYDTLESGSSYRIYKSGGFSSQELMTDLYTYEGTEVISAYSVEDVGNYSIIYVPDYIQSEEEDYPVLPRKMVTIKLPLGSVVTNMTILEKSDPVDIVESDIPSLEGELVDRICGENSYDASVKYSHLFTDDYEVVLIELNPVDVVDCENGVFRLYRNIKYKVDYLPDSSVLFKTVYHPDVVFPKYTTGINVEFNRVKSEPVDGIVRLTLDGHVVAEKNINFDVDQFTIPLVFDAPEDEGFYDYVLEFVENDRVTSRTKFSIKVAMIDAVLRVPNKIWQSTNVMVDIYNHLNSPLNFTLYYELQKDDGSVKKSGSATGTLNLGVNVVDLAFENLLKVDRSYSLSVQLYYSDYQKVLNALLVTNNPPSLTDLSSINVEEGELVVIEPHVSDPDYDPVTFSISDPVGDDGRWIPSYSDSGNYTVTVSANDGYLTTSRDIIVSVANVEPDDRTVVFRDCNYGLYRGGLSEVSLYDYQTDRLQSWYMDGQYDEVADYFAVRTTENWPLGTCERGDEFVCIEDSDEADPTWGAGDDYPDPVFELGGECETDILPLYKYKDHEVCQGNVECEYPACMQDSDCGYNQWIGEKYCVDEVVYLNLRNFTCINATTYESSCVHEDIPVLLQECNSLQECYLGNCVDIECSTASDCGEPYDVGNYCTASGVYNKQRSFVCDNPGTALSRCRIVDDDQFVETCDLFNQVCMLGQCINRENFMLGNFSDGSSTVIMTFYEYGSKDAYIVLPKNIDVVDTSLKVRGGKQ